MTYLLDTHVWVWWHMSPQRLSREVRAILGAPARYDELLLSAISPWELAKLVDRNRLTLSCDVSVWIEAALDMPPSASEYTNAGLPWFDYYGKDQTALPGGKNLKEIQSVASIFKEKTGANLPQSSDIQSITPIRLDALINRMRQIKKGMSFKE